MLVGEKVRKEAQGALISKYQYWSSAIKSAEGGGAYLISGLKREGLTIKGRLCSRKNPYPPHGRSLKIPKRRGLLKAKFLEAMYENKLDFPGGRGVPSKKPSVGGVWIVSGTA